LVRQWAGARRGNKGVASITGGRRGWWINVRTKHDAVEEERRRTVRPEATR
jgi:hypothetical protein